MQRPAIIFFGSVENWKDEKTYPLLNGDVACTDQILPEEKVITPDVRCASSRKVRGNETATLTYARRNTTYGTSNHHTVVPSSDNQVSFPSRLVISDGTTAKTCTNSTKRGTNLNTNSFRFGQVRHIYMKSEHSTVACFALLAGLDLVPANLPQKNREHHRFVIRYASNIATSRAVRAVCNTAIPFQNFQFSVNFLICYFAKFWTNCPKFNIFFSPVAQTKNKNLFTSEYSEIWPVLMI